MKSIQVTTQSHNEHRAAPCESYTSVKETHANTLETHHDDEWRQLITVRCQCRGDGRHHQWCAQQTGLVDNVKQAAPHHGTAQVAHGSTGEDAGHHWGIGVGLQV